MRKYCDLHTHSIYSDGTWTPTQIVCEAEKLGLSAVALTDHNSVAGLPEFLHAAKDLQVEAVAGVELSTDYGDTELHILGLFIPTKAFQKVDALVEEMLQRKMESNRLLIKNLQDAGYEIGFGEVQESAAGQFNRAHVAAKLTEKGYTPSIESAFQTLLSKKAPFYIEPKRIDALESIAFLKSIGAAAVLAHPFLNLTEEALRAFLAQAKEYGLDGMETIYSKYSAETTNAAVNIAKEFGLKQSGGSDFHGDRKPDIFLGTGKGNLCVPTAFFNGLRP